MFSFRDFLTELRLTIKYHNKLNPAIFTKGNYLSDDDTSLLVSKAWEFVKFSGIDKERVTDIVFTGSNANFNYTKFSDVDVHVMCDESGLDPKEIYKKKVEWAKSHKDLKLGKYPIEMYIQDTTEHWPQGQGVYSLLQRKWLVEPVHLGTIDVLNDPKTEEKIDHEIKTIKQLIKNGTKQAILAFKERMWRMRSAGLESGGEFSLENITYKDLRNRGLIDKLNDKLHHIQ